MTGVLSCFRRRSRTAQNPPAVRKTWGGVCGARTRKGSRKEPLSTYAFRLCDPGGLAQAADALRRAPDLIDLTPVGRCLPVQSAELVLGAPVSTSCRLRPAKAIPTKPRPKAKTSHTRVPSLKAPAPNTTRMAAVTAVAASRPRSAIPAAGQFAQ